MIYELPRLNYDYAALEPAIDAATMEIHYRRHHQGYIDKLNTVLAKYPRLAEQSLPDLMGNLERLEIPEADKLAIRNFGGGHLNHSLFWEILGPKKELNNLLIDQLKSTFGSLEAFSDQFTRQATNHFGSGWAWLVQTEDEKLVVYSLPNQDSPYLLNHLPLLGLDLWEHAYYLKYHQDRAAYIRNWWSVLKLIP